MTAWRASILTLFPGMFPGPLGLSLAGEALRNGHWRLDVADIRECGLGRHRSVDDTPAGGGPGMVMRCDVLAAAIDANIASDDLRPRLLMSPRGRRFDQELARKFSAAAGIVIVCGRFEGVDDRIVTGRNLVEVSLGDFVLSGGEPAALAILDACLRLVPGVMGAESSAQEESFESGLLEYPHFTRPRVWEGRAIPDVLLSGNHAEIARWRRTEAERITLERRPELLKLRAKP